MILVIDYLNIFVKDKMILINFKSILGESLCLSALVAIFLATKPQRHKGAQRTKSGRINFLIIPGLKNTKLS
jgi:hypothetical protein